VRREQVRRVDLTVDLAEVYASQPDGLLNPQSVGIEVTQFAQTLS
jgi:hypothetical protein